MDVVSGGSGRPDDAARRHPDLLGDGPDGPGDRARRRVVGVVAAIVVAGVAAPVALRAIEGGAAAVVERCARQTLEQQAAGFGGRDPGFTGSFVALSMGIEATRGCAERAGLSCRKEDSQTLCRRGRGPDVDVGLVFARLIVGDRDPARPTSPA